MRLHIAKEDPACESLIPPAKPDNSGVGVNYAEAYLKALNAATLPDGRKVAIKRKGLKVTVTIGTASGSALLRKRENGPDPKVILRRALEEAAAKIGSTFVVENGEVYLDISSA